MSSILIIEDEPRIAGFIAKGLKSAGFTSETTPSGEMGAFEPDLQNRRRHGPREGRPGPDGDRGGRPDRPGGPAGASVVVVTDHGADPAPEHFQ